MNTPRSVLLRMRNVSGKSCKKFKTHFMFSKLFPENRDIQWIMLKNMVEAVRPQTTVWRMRIAWWISKATTTHTEYVIRITPPRKQWLHERTSRLRSCVHCLSGNVTQLGMFVHVVILYCLVVKTSPSVADAQFCASQKERESFS